MPDWDVNSPELQRNLRDVLLKARDQAIQRKIPTLEDIRDWHRMMMRGLTPKSPAYVGAFRGEKGLEDVEVRVLSNFGVPARHVAQALKKFEGQLQAKVKALDRIVGRAALADAATLQAVIELCAWAHAEWVRIHPFANGNGRTARLLANCLAMRYGLPAFVRLRPRPDGYKYAKASERAMHGQWQLTVPVFVTLLNEALSGP